jgi:hypothetical protein
MIDLRLLSETNIPHAGAIDVEDSITVTSTSEDIEPEPDASGAFRFDPMGGLEGIV